MGKQMSAAELQQINFAARQAVLARSIDMLQSVYSNTISSGAAITNQNNVVNIPPRYVGFIKGFYVQVQADMVVPSSSTATITNFGPANILSQISFTDLNNNIRIQTAGWHMNMINTVKGGRAFGANNTLTTYPIDIGSSFPRVISAPSPITTTTVPLTSTVYMTYWIPLAYTEDDLRGGIYGNVVNATMNLQLTINPTPFVASGDSTLAMYSGVAGTMQNVSIQVYQSYLDQLPQNGQGPILPILDMSTMYEIKNTNLSGITTAQDFPIPYSNFRDYLSTTVIYNNGGTLNVGSDVNYWALQSANFTNIFKIDPYLAALRTRQAIGDDMPNATYYFDHRRKPINTIQYGNMNLILNAAGTVNANAVLYIGFEDLALINMVTGAGSLPGG